MSMIAISIIISTLWTVPKGYLKSWKSEDCPDYRNAEIGQYTEKSPEDLKI